tara:strand:+ start:1198 stop:1920 length:723 start_codon:yes stop_codon:yes gene_type:complete
MRKIGIVFTVLVAVGCSKPSDSLQITDRANKFLGGYAEFEILELGDNGYKPQNAYNYLEGHNQSDTLQAIDELSSKLKSKSDSTRAIANVFLTKPEALKQCIIVHRPQMTKSTLTHELGHCYNVIYFKKLEKVAPDLYAVIEDEKEGSRFLIESFAEVAAATIAFRVDGNHSYLENRIKELKSMRRYEEMKPYTRSIPLLENLKGFLQKSTLPASVSSQVDFMLDNFYLNPDFNTNIHKK